MIIKFIDKHESLISKITFKDMDLIIQIRQFLFYCVNYGKCYLIALIKHIDNVHTIADSHLDNIQTLMKIIQYIIQKLQQELELTIFKSEQPNAEYFSQQQPQTRNSN